MSKKRGMFGKPVIESGNLDNTGIEPRGSRGSRRKGKYRIVAIEGQGYGYMSPEDFSSTPRWARKKIHVLGTCDTKAQAEQAVKAYHPGWKKKVICGRGDG